MRGGGCKKKMIEYIERRCKTWMKETKRMRVTKETTKYMHLLRHKRWKPRYTRGNMRQSVFVLNIALLKLADILDDGKEFGV